ncbi:fructosamine kinase family protein [Ferrimonas lipolytica]|uniref:Fructosamine kinase family protein n=1 Tax=Ferrimonas lipolytica TaxID=2724191 RepID=A0A6H1UBQ3_9GAMM|nr:fructosamine kinase family protein [Ferrimonas lipolytica]QIZ76517.1 fructosamine kinase family protein [Ferrimonas lipolytica]
MWNAIGLQISDALGRDFAINEKHSIVGGDIHQAFKINDHHCALFVKLSDKHNVEMFESEAHALRLLRKQTGLVVPEVVTTGTTSHNSFIALEHLNLGNGSKADWYRFGQELAQLHRTQTQPQFGFDEDNYIGTTVQPNRWQNNWAEFFAEQRIGWQLKLAQDKGYNFGGCDSIVRRCAEKLRKHKPVASLLHGDLWRGNIAFVDGVGALFDPASYYGDRETDIAMTELFSPLPTDFYHGYNAEWPLPDDYQARKPIYQLYHLLNHLNLFGGSYLQQCQSLIQEQLCEQH